MPACDIDRPSQICAEVKQTGKQYEQTKKINNKQINPQ
jgi:hypothetical protein